MKMTTYVAVGLQPSAVYNTKLFTSRQIDTVLAHIHRKFKYLAEVCIYRVSHELMSLLREGVPYVKLYRYNPKHLYPKLIGYGDNGQRSLKL
jgi:hypothetical protein